MCAFRSALASLGVAGIVLLNCVCVCSPSAMAEPTPGAHAGCTGDDGTSRSSHPGTAPHHQSSGSCPHCDHAQVVAAKTDGGPALATALQVLWSAILPHLVTPENAPPTLRRPFAVVHSPPSRALLRQKCVLLI